MIWCRFRAGETERYGLVEGDRVSEVEGSPFEGYSLTSRTHDLAAVKLLVPVVPSTFFCAGINYRDHVIRMAALGGREPVFPSQADIGYRANNALIAHGEPIVIPRDASEEVQYEGELVAVFGKKARNVSKAEALTTSWVGRSATTSASAPGSATTARSGAARTPTRSSRWARG